ncbi:hypothetical protein SLUN_35540 [Streptomyces lunaelactis]|uniref:Transmembrane protein n=1 Tax=Streptomyces lunaelactis TaxID=1535768 RepID=A0A2R4TC77_9ACTN|nr:hypothetical protein [Streptomyces lunaelactis]AVZ76728.1 hypothetical protein SLUN_35540 [Streptomyces lunaelactis]NUK83590.1 hypothetical protein [Streptomyces lunaelactis]
MGRKVRLWRWRCNPLRRRSYVVEGWIILGLASVTFVAAPLVGAVACEAVRDARAHERHERHVTAATLEEDAAPAAAGATRAGAVARWAAPDGTARIGRVPVTGQPRRGARVDVWTDRHGAVTAAPVSAAAARIDAVLAGVAIAAFICLLALAGRRIVGWQLDRRRSELWACEWTRVGPRWDRRNA